MNLKLGRGATGSLAALFTLLFSALSAVAANDHLLTLETDSKAELVSIGQPVGFSARIINRSDRTLRGRLVWSIETVALTSQPPAGEEVVVGPGETLSRSATFEIRSPGFLNVLCRLESPQLEKTLRRARRIGAKPERIRFPLTAEQDCDSFWADSLNDLARVDPQWTVELQESTGNPAVAVYEVSMESVDGVRVGGWLEVPDARGPHPVVLRVPGYGGNMKPISRWDDMIVFSFNPRGHGNSQDDVPGQPVDYWIRGLEDKRSYFYRGAYLDCVRAVDFLMSRTDVDPDRIAVWGGSQGGGLAFSTAALDDRVDLCVADIPWLCDWVNYFRLTDWPEMNRWIEDESQRTWPKTLRTLSYFDTMNLAARIRCPTLMGIGLQDAICPPETSFATFNRIPSKKEFRIYRDRGHGLGSEHWQWCWTQIRERFGLSVQP